MHEKGVEKTKTFNNSFENDKPFIHLASQQLFQISTNSSWVVILLTKNQMSYHSAIKTAIYYPRHASLYFFFYFDLFSTTSPNTESTVRYALLNNNALLLVYPIMFSCINFCQIKSH